MAAAIAQLAIKDASSRRDAGAPQAMATALKALQHGTQSLEVLVTAAEAAIKAGDLKLARSSLDAFFAEAQSYHGTGPQCKAEARSQAMCRALFAAGQLVCQLSSSFKGQALVDGVLEAVRYIMQGIELAATNARYTYLIYNGSVHYWHISRPLQCDQLRSHLLPSAERLNQLLEQVEGQPAWRVRHLMALAMCQAEGPRREDASKTLTKAMDVAMSGGLTALKHEVAALTTHVQSQQASRLAAGKAAAGPAGKAGAAAGAGGKAAAGAGGQPPGIAAAARQRTGELGSIAADKLDEAGALSILQWVLSSRPDAAAAEQQLEAAWKMVDPKPNGPSRNALLRVVARLGWAAALSGATQLAEQCAKRAASSPDIGPRVWSDLTRLLIALQAAPAATLAPGSSTGFGSTVCPEGLQARKVVLEGVEEAVTQFMKLQDVDGVHCCAKLAWNAGLPLLQPRHRHLLKPCFTAAAKALEAACSPLAKLRVALHLEVAKAEADADSFLKASKEVSLALSLNYPPSPEAAAIWGYERLLDRFLQPLARAARLRGGSHIDDSDGTGGLEALSGADDDAVVLLERAKESMSQAMRLEYLQKAVDKLVLLPPVNLPSAVAASAPGVTPGSAVAAVAPGAAAAPGATRAQQLQKARARTEIWAEIVQLAWVPYELDEIVRDAAPFVLAADWQEAGDNEMLLLQARIAFIESEACKLALTKLEQELVPPAGYNAEAQSAAPSEGPGAADLGDNAVRLPSSTVEQLQRLLAEDLYHGMRLAVASNQPWVLMNGALAAWNAYVSLLQKQRFAELAGVLLPLLKLLLQGGTQVDPNLVVMLAEAAAKAAEHIALLYVLQPPPDSDESDLDTAGTEDPFSLWSYRAAETPWFVPLSEARSSTASLDIPKMLQQRSDASESCVELLQLLSATSDVCQAALTTATTAAEPQGLLQAFARLQQMQGKPIAVPAGAPASMAITSKVLVLIEGMAVNTASTGAAAAVPMPGPSSKPPSTGGARATTDKAPAASAVTKVEQDIRTAMSLLASAPAVNLELWAQLSKAAGSHSYWQLARECANAAAGVLPAGKRDLQAVVAAADVPEVSPQGWYWLAIAELQQAQAALSLLSSCGQDAASRLALNHNALCHFATSGKLAAFVNRTDLTECAARHCWNVCAASGFLHSGLTRTALIPQLKTICAALNATRPGDVAFQVSLNILLLECLVAAGHWAAARRHVEALQRCLPPKPNGPAAAAALVEVAGWRASCLVHASLATTPRLGEDMNRLLSELSTPKARAHAWLSFAQASSCKADQLAARTSALAALEGHPADQVEYQIGFAEWLVVSGSEGECKDTSAEGLLSAAVSTLLEIEATAAEEYTAATDADETASVASRASCVSFPRSSGPNRAAGSAGSTLVATAARRRGNTAESTSSSSKRAGRQVGRCVAVKGHSRTAVSVAVMEPGGGGKQPVTGFGVKEMDRLIRAFMMLSQVVCSATDRQAHLLQAQHYAALMLTSSLVAAGAIKTASNNSCGIASAQNSAAEPRADDAAGKGSGADESRGHAGSEQAANGSTAATAIISAPAAAVRAGPGVVESLQLPADQLSWACWQPTAELLTVLSAAAGNTNSSSNTSKRNRTRSNIGSAMPPTHVATHAAGPAASKAAAGNATAVAAAALVLSSSTIRVPELLLANLQLLAESLKESCQHVAALPVMQLARLVATVTLGSKTMAASITLQLAALCEELGLAAEAAAWLKLAAPESWPTPQQQQEAAHQAAVQQLVAQVLAQSSTTASDKEGAITGAAGSSSSTNSQVSCVTCQLPQHCAFLLAAVQQAEPSHVQAWLKAANSSGCSGSTANTAVDSSQGAWRPASATKLRIQAQARPSSAAAVASTGEEAVLRGRVQWLQPLALQHCWLGIAKYLVERAQYTPAMRLCTEAVELARAAADPDTEAQVLLQQARLAALAQRPEEAIDLVQSAQQLGGGLQFWRECLELYAAVRGGMRSGGPKDAVSALEGGIAMMETLARGDASTAHLAVKAAGPLKLQLSKLLASQAQQQLQEGEYAAAQKLHSKAHALAVKAEKDMQETGAVCLRIRAVQQLVELMWQDPERMLLQEQHKQRQMQLRQQRETSVDGAEGLGEGVLLPLDETPLLLEARCMLQVAELEALAMQAPGTPLGCSTPAARMLASVQLQLAAIELELGALRITYTAVDRAAQRPAFPEVEGRDAQAVIEYLEQLDAQVAGQGQSDMRYYELAASHASAAAIAVSAAPAQHAAALLASGQASMQQAHAAMLIDATTQQRQQRKQEQTQCLLSTSWASSGVDSSAAVDAEAAWVPWPLRNGKKMRQHQQHNTVRSAAGAGTASSSTSGSAEQGMDTAPCVSLESQCSLPGPKPTQEASLGSIESGGVVLAHGNNIFTANSQAEADVCGSHGNSIAGAVTTAAAAADALELFTIQELPVSAVPAHSEAVLMLQQSLAKALDNQQLRTARAAALGLARCYGLLQPQLAADCLAVAQSCKSSETMRDVFTRCAAVHHGEVLLWRQLEQLQQHMPATEGHTHVMQVQQLQSLIGLTTKRLKVTPADSFSPLLSTLQPDQRLLLLHYDETRQELLLAAWNVEGKLPAPPTPPAVAAAGDPLSTGNTGGSSSETGEENAVGKKEKDVSAATAAAASPPPPPRITVLGRMRLPKQQLDSLTESFRSYKRLLHKEILEVTATPPPAPAAPPVAAPAAAAAITTSAQKKSAGAAAGKAAGNDKGAREDERPGETAGVPTLPVFLPEFNTQGQQLLQQFESLLQPLSVLLSKAVAVAAASTDHVTGGKPGAAAAGRPTSAKGKASAGRPTSAKAAQPQLQPQQLLNLQLLIDPELCPLPWEALSCFSSSCRCIARCFSMAQLQQLLQPPGSTAVQAAAAAASAVGVQAVPAVLDISRLTFIADPLCEASDQQVPPGCYAPPLLPLFRQQLQEPLGHDWQGLAGVPGQVPSEQQLERVIAPAKGLLVLSPGRLLARVPPTVVSKFDLSACTAAVLLDRLDSKQAAARQLHLDNRKYLDELELEGPTHTAMLLLLRGVRSIALTTIAGTPHTHMQLASAVLKAMTGTAVTTAAGGKSTLGEAVWSARREVLAGFELAALKDCGIVVYGLAGVVAGEGDSGKSKAASKK